MSTSPSHHGYRWHHELKQLFVQGLERYRAGEINPAGHFDQPARDFLASIGLGAQELFDFVEDHVRYEGEPDWETLLLISAARRDYFIYEQHSQPSRETVAMEALPAKDDPSVGGLPWLARLIKKAEAKLRGEMPAELMYCCGGDRKFFREHSLHPADFLRCVWAARGDTSKVLAHLRDASGAA